MTPHVLNPCIERVARAHVHLADLRSLLAALFKAQEDSITWYFDSNPSNTLRVGVPEYPMPPMLIGVLIGEICYNLRSALDYLVYELAKLDSGAPQKGTQFLIEDTPNGFAGRSPSFLKGLNAAHVAAIEGLQPYNGCDWTKALRDLSNRDKHRELAEIEGDFKAIAHTRSLTPNFDRISGTVHRTPHPRLGEVDVKLEFTARIFFPDGTAIVETLEVVKLKVAETLAAFKLEF